MSLFIIVQSRPVSTLWHWYFMNILIKHMQIIILSMHTRIYWTYISVKIVTIMYTWENLNCRHKLIIVSQLFATLILLNDIQTCDALLCSKRDSNCMGSSYVLWTLKYITMSPTFIDDDTEVPRSVMGMYVHSSISSVMSVSWSMCMFTGAWCLKKGNATHLLGV